MQGFSANVTNMASYKGRKRSLVKYCISVRCALVLTGLVAFRLLMEHRGLNTLKEIYLTSRGNITLKDSMTLSDFNRKDVRSKKILYWTPIPRYKDFSFGNGQEPFIKAKCKVFNCVTTKSREEVTEADALIFHIREFKTFEDIPSVRLPHQWYALFALESPDHIRLNNIKRLNNFFNMTMLYSKQADVRVPYGRIEKRGEIPYKPYSKDTIQNKTKFALAIISNCKTKSQREDVIKALQPYIQVDVLGICNKLNRSTYDCEKSYNASCINTIISQYKFYFSFESFLCEEYASEKLYKVLHLPVIPVVYGGSNYSDLLPTNSFIDVRDFKTAASLAAYLKEVAADVDKYLSYFTWRKELRQSVNINLNKNKFINLEPRVMCDLCEYLHINSNKTKILTDMPAVYGREKYCFAPGQWLRGFVSKP